MTNYIFRLKYILALFNILTAISSFAQIKTPLEIHNFQKTTSYDDLSNYVHQLDETSDLLKVENIGQSVEGRNLFGMYFSATGFGADPSKVKVLIFAQQHGNEQSGKEGVLLLAGELLKPENQYLFSKIDLILVPQVNPDGSEINNRRNGHDMDLNRNHLILTEPETQALHRLFNQYHFEATLDVHEYFPYLDDWKALGFRKNADITVGATTNINISDKIRTYSYKKGLPFLLKFLSDQHFSSCEYLPGGPPEKEYIRRSTFDINDGRQSMGIQNTFSFIQEGKNGTDNLIENIEHRTRGQMTGMLGFLEFVYHNQKKIKNLVEKERAKLVNSSIGNNVAIQMKHVSGGEKLDLPVYFYASNSDSTITVFNYRPKVEAITEVVKPVGYLIPKNQTELISWANRHQLNMYSFDVAENLLLEQYHVFDVDSIDFEGDIVVDPKVDIRNFEIDALENEFVFIPTAQLKGNMIVTALEPKSILGLVTYKEFAYLLQKESPFPVLRVIKIK